MSESNIDQMPGVVTSDSSTQAKTTIALTILTIFCFMSGFMTSLSWTLVPHLQDGFKLDFTKSMYIPLCFFFGYFITSIPASLLTNKFGYKKGLITGLCTAGLGTFFIYTAAKLESYPAFLLGMYILASGITFLEVSLNPYVSILGHPDTASSRLNLAQGFNSLGTVLSPLFSAAFILATINAVGINKVTSVQKPYLFISLTLVAFAVLFSLLKLPDKRGGEDQTNQSVATSKYSEAFKHKTLLLGILGIFLYVGSEVSIASLLIKFLGEPNIANLAKADASRYVSFYWIGAMLGRFLGAATLKKLNPGKVLVFNASVATILIAITVLTSGRLAMWAILAVGLCNSIMFPTIFSLSIKDLGRFTSKASGLLCTGIVGGGLIPLLHGNIVDRIGIQPSFSLLAFCYIYIAFFGYICFKRELKSRI